MEVQKYEPLLGRLPPDVQRAVRAYLGLDDPSQSRLATGLALERRSFVSRTVRIAELTLWALTDPEATTWVKEEFYQCH